MQNKYKPFDLEKALNGDPVVTREGRPVKEIFFFMTIPEKKCPVAAAIGENIRVFTRNGFLAYDGRETDIDLLMAPVKHERWIAVFRNGKGAEPYVSAAVYASEKEVQDLFFGSARFLKAVKIHEWEE